MESIQVRTNGVAIFAIRDMDACLEVSKFLRQSPDFSTSSVDMETQVTWVKHEYIGEDDTALTLIRGMVLYLSPGMIFYEVS
jgi:hypothetical protein